MKDNGEVNEFTSSISFDDHQIIVEEVDVINDDKGYFGSDTKEHISYLKSSVEIPNSVEEKPPPNVCELGNMKEKNLVQRDAHHSDFCTLL